MKPIDHCTIAIPRPALHRRIGFYAQKPTQITRKAGRPGSLLLAISLVTALSACHQAAPATDAPRDVVVLSVHANSQKPVLTLPIEVQARFVTPMSFRVAGQVLERRVHLGDSVHKGDVVARLDPADAEHTAVSADADLASAHEHLEAASKQLQRDTLQARDNLISALQLEQTQDTYAAALSQAKAAQARASLAGNQKGYTRLVAEHDGVISAEQANTGEVLTAGQPVFSLAWSDANDVTADVAENRIGAVRVGAPATVRLAALPGRVLQGRVREVSPAADPQSRTYRVKITLESHDPQLRLGMTGEVTIDISPPSAAASKEAVATVVIPATALFHEGSRPAVWIVRPADASLELRPVTVGGYGERSVTLSGGAAVGEKIVVQGVHTLTAGEKVHAIAPLHAEDFDL